MSDEAQKVEVRLRWQPMAFLAVVAAGLGYATRGADNGSQLQLEAPRGGPQGRPNMPGCECPGFASWAMKHPFLTFFLASSAIGGTTGVVRAALGDGRNEVTIKET